MAAFGDRGMGRDLLRAVAEQPADLVVIDCFMFGALDAARRAGLPYLVLEHTFDDYYERGLPARPARAQPAAAPTRAPPGRRVRAGCAW